MVDDSSEDKVEAICNGLCSYILYTSVQCTLQDADIIATGDLELPYKEGAEWSKTKVVIQFPFQPHPRNTLLYCSVGSHKLSCALKKINASLYMQDSVFQEHFLVRLLNV